MPDGMNAHLKRDLFHLVWELMLDDEFAEAWCDGMVVDECQERRLGLPAADSLRGHQSDQAGCGQVNGPKPARERVKAP